MSNTHNHDEFKITDENIKKIVVTQQLIGKLIGVIATRTNCKNELIQIINNTVNIESDMFDSVEYSKNAMLTAINLVKVDDA